MMKERERTVILKCFTSFAGVASGGQHQTQYRSADLSAGSRKKNRAKELIHWRCDPCWTACWLDYYFHDLHLGPDFFCISFPKLQQWQRVATVAGYGWITQSRSGVRQAPQAGTGTQTESTSVHVPDIGQSKHLGSAIQHLGVRRAISC